VTQLSTHRHETPPSGDAEPETRPAHILMVAANMDSRFGGVSAVLGPLCSAIQEDPRFRVSIAAFAEPDENLEQLESFAPVTRYPLRGLSALYRGEPRSQSGVRFSRQVENADLVHIHGLWQEHCAFAASVARRSSKPYVISSHGMLDTWALEHKRWKKALYLQLIERKNLSGANALHALTSAEVADYNRVTSGKQIETIPNAVDLPQKSDPNLFFSTYKELAGKTIVLFLSRLHPKKGLDLLSEAWSRVAPDFPNAHLVIAGPDFADMQRDLEATFSAGGVSGAVTFTGMLSGGMKWSALAASQLFVLPSRSEGLSMAALEAMGMGKPVLLTRQCHVDQLLEQECGWQIEPDVNQLEAALRDFLRSPQRARTKGANGRRLVETRHSWELIGARMRALYGRFVSSQTPLLRSV
jgi:glycosyltransferase involved in cell wall biosynthesis